MERLRRTEYIELRQVLLYLDDFLAIVRLFKDHCESVEVTVENFRLDECSETEIQQLKDELQKSQVSDLTIEARRITQEHFGKAGPRDIGLPSISLRLFGGNGMIVLLDADDITAKGLSTLILERLRYRKLARFMNDHAWLSTLAALSPVVTMVLLLRLFPNNRVVSISLVASALLLSFLFLRLWLGPFFPSSEKAYPSLRLQKRAEHPGFLIRNKDELIKGIVLLLVGAALTLLMQWFLKLPS